jgi:hypothetical protein
MEAALPRRVEHCRRIVYPENVRARRGELLGQRSIAAAQIKDAHASLRRQQLHDSRGEGCDEAAIGRVGCCVPGLAGRDRCAHVSIVGIGAVRARAT